MSKPKPAIGSVKRRGLAIATAVAVAGSGFMPANYAFAQEANNESQEAELKAPTAEEAFTAEEATIKAELVETKDPHAATQKVAGKFKFRFGADKDAFDQFEWELEQKIKKLFVALIANNEINLGADYSLPVAKDYFQTHEQSIGAALRPADGSDGQQVDEIVNHHVAELERSFNFGTDAAKADWTAQFRGLVADKQRALYPEYFVAGAQDYFESREAAIAADLRPSDGAEALDVDAVVEKYASQVERDQLDFGVGNDKEAWKSEFRGLVQQLADKLDAEALAEAKKVAYDELQASGINPEQNKVFKQQIDDAADIGAVEKLLETIKVVADNPVESFAPSRPDAPKPPVDESEIDDEQQPSSPLLEQALRTAKEKAWDYVAGSEGLTAEDKQRFQGEITAAADLQAVEDIHAEVVRAEREAGAHRALLDNELGVNSNPVVDPNKQSLIAEDLAAPFAKHRDEMAKQEAEDLAEAKGAAKAAIDGAQHLSDELKKAYKGAVDAASTERQVEELVYGALDGAEQGEDYAKIQEQLDSNEAPAFSPNEKSWTPEDFLNSFHQNAANEAAADLADARDAAVAAVEGSQHLSDAQKAAYKGALEAATTTRQIDGLVNAALDSADLQEEAVEAGAHRALLDNELGVNSNPAFDSIKELLTAEDLAAPFAKHRDEVAKQEAAEKLAASKTAAAVEVEGATRLTENQKSEFKGRIGAAKTVEEVKAVLDEAHQLVDKHAAEEADKGELADEKVQAHRIIDGLDKLSPEQKAAFKKQVEDANTGAYVAHVVERAQEMNAQQNPSGDGAGAQEPGKPGNNETPGKPGSDNKPGKDQKPGSTTDAFKGFFGLAAGMGVFALIFGGIMHAINHFDGFGVVQEHVRNAFAKIGIRF